MITVRFPSGLAIQYNSGWYIEAWGERNVAIKDTKEGNLIAVVPRDCLIEWVAPCRIYNSSTNETESKIFRELRLLRSQLKSKRKKRVRK
jgi:hypothetical protein